jgi:cell fate regulator YaaT (PSP1 superfamily)
MEPTIIGIRFQEIGKTYHFDAGDHQQVKVGDFVVVDTSRGCQLGEVMQIIKNPPPPTDGSWKTIKRIATARDLVLRQLWKKKEKEAVVNFRTKMVELKILGVKIVDAEYTFDGKRLSILYNTEAEEKVDLQKLQQAMKRLYPRTRIGMRQIGPRDVAKVIGGMGACGMGERCCSKFLTEFNPISIRMAKEQGISLTPSEITGMCGRLRCCLDYEYEQYLELRKELPKRKDQVNTSHGQGRVIDLIPLKQSVSVLLESGKTVEVSLAELRDFQNEDKKHQEEKQTFSDKQDQIKDNVQAQEKPKETSKRRFSRRRPSQRNRRKK